MKYKKLNHFNPILVDVVIYANVAVFMCLGFISLPVFAKKLSNPNKPVNSEISIAKDVPDVILVKVKKQAQPQLDSNINSAETGVKTLDDKIKGKNKSVQAEKILKKTKTADNNSDLARWVKIKVKNPGNPSTDSNGNIHYPDVDNIINELKKDPNIEAVEKDKSVPPSLVPNDTFYSTSDNIYSGVADMWGQKYMNAEKAWDITTGSSSIITAVMDTGVDYNHEDLASNIWRNSREIAGNGIDDDSNGFIDDIRGWDFIMNNNDPADKLDNSYSGHGSHVSGSIAAVGNNGIGVAGMSWNSKIMPIRVCGPGLCVFSALISGMQYASDNGARIVNMSLGAASSYYSPFADAIKYAHDRNVTIISAAGNSSQDVITTNTYPAGDPKVIDVGAIDPTHTMSSFSNYGTKTDVFAPGRYILSVKGTGANLSGYTCNAIFADKYCGMSGTSMATPQVAGIATLMLGTNPNLTNEQIRQIIRTSSTSMGSMDTYGYGSVNAEKSVLASLSPNVLVPQISNSIYNTTVTKMLPIKGSVTGPNLASYKLEIGNGYYPSSWTKLAEGTTNIATDSLINNFNTYTYANGLYVLRLTATNKAGESFFYAIHAVTIGNLPDATLPSVPTNITAELTSSSVSLQWSASTDDIAGVQKYIVKRNGTTIGSPTNTTIFDTGLQPSTAYSYTVQAVDLAGNTSNTGTINATTLPDSTPPSQVTNFIANNVTKHGITLSWDSSIDNVAVTGYKIYRNNVLVNTLTGNSWSDGSLSVNTNYNYKIEAFDTAGNASTQTSLNVRTLPDATPPSASFRLPLSGSTQNKTARIFIDANDDEAIQKIEIFVNEVLAKTFTSAPYDDTINLIAYANGTASVKAVATDTAGNSSQTTTSIIVSNPKRGDINNDAKVDIYDISLLLASWNKIDLEKDLNSDNLINIFDLSILLSEFGK